MAHPDSVPFYQSHFWRKLRAACFNRDGGVCVVPGCGRPSTHADHIVTRPRSPVPTSLDVLSNLRSLCAQHDTQAKEIEGGARRGGGFLVRGCDAGGWPRDPGRMA